MTRYESGRDLEQRAERIERVRARMAAGVRLVQPEPKLEPGAPKPIGTCQECGLPIVRLDAGLVCYGQPYPDHKPRRRPFTEKQLHARTSRLIRQVERAAKQCVQESRGTVGFDDAAHDCGLSLAMMQPPAVRARFYAGYLGWDPYDDADLYRREATDPRLAR